MVEKGTPVLDRPGDPGRLDRVFHALAHPLRRGMLAALAEGPRTVGQLAQPLPVSLAAASKHLGVLRRAGLVRVEVEGRSHRCRLDPGPLAPAAEWLAYYRSFWAEGLEALAEMVEEDGPTDRAGAQGRPARKTRKSSTPRRRGTRP
jgi:DNA-binding transcriptional ArsR family regulator